MQNTTGPARTLPRQIAQFIVWTLIFATAYAQSPLYTSNQNQYFLHGLARSGYGFLNHDWLANTLDPTPVFSLLVGLTYRFLHWEGLFYIYYALLMGIYLFSLVGIVQASVWGERPNPPAPPFPCREGGKSAIDRSEDKSTASLSPPFPLREGGTGGLGPSSNPSFLSLRIILFLALLILTHSAALRFLLSRILGVNWTYILEDGVADQRLLGPVFQPSTFGALLVLSILLFLRRRPYLAILSAVLAATLHPTYLLSAGVLTFAYLLVAYIEERKVNSPARFGLVAAVSVVPILYYVFNSFGGTALQAATRAQEILVSYRIPHHAVFSQWFDATVMVKLLLVVSALYLLRSSRLFLILFIPALAAVALTAAQVLLDSTALALLFPWRLSIFLVPLSTAVWLAWIADWIVTRVINRSEIAPPEPPALQEKTLLEAAGVDRSSPVSSLPARRREKMESFLLAASAAAIFVPVVIGAVRFKLDLDRKSAAPERVVEEFVAKNKTYTDLYLIPVKLQDFRLASGAPAFVDFKSIPYKDEDVLEWYRRVQLADRFYKDPTCEQLSSIAAQEGITHFVLESDSPQISCTEAQEVYNDNAFLVYALKNP